MTSQLYIRAIEEDDAQKVATLIKDAREAMRGHYSEIFLDENLPADTAADIRALMKRRHMFVAVENNHIAGTASLYGTNVGRVFVEKTSHRKGIGKKLVDHLEQHALTFGLNSLRTLSSLNAINFYESCGFHVIRPVISHAAFPAMLMEKRISREGLDLLSAYPLLRRQLEMETGLLKGVNPATLDLLQKEKYEIFISQNEQKETVALIAGYNIYDFSSALSGFEICVFNIRPEYDQEKYLSRIIKEMAMRIYCDDGRIIAFKGSDIRKKMIGFLKRGLNGDEDKNSYVMAENEIRQFTRN